MNYIEYFKSQAKKLYKDFQTQYIPENEDNYSYRPKFWPDIVEIIVMYNIDEGDFCLMKAQHIVALLAGFDSWNELTNATPIQLEIGYYLVEHRGNNAVEEWQWYELYADLDRFDEYAKLEIFKQVFLRNIEK